MAARRRCGRPRWSRSRASRCATCRSRCAPRSICARSSRPTSGRRRSATSTRCWSIAAIGCGAGSSWRWFARAICPISSPPPAARWPRRSRRRRWRARTSSAPRRWRPRRWSRSRSCSRRRAQLATAEATQQAAQAQIAAVAVRLGETRIASPLDGVVVQRRLDPGALVGPPGGGAILTVARVDVLRVFITVNERELAGVRVGKDAHVELDALPGRTFAGKVVRLSPALDPVTRTLDAEVQLDNRAGELRPGHVRARRDRRRGAPEGARWCRWARCVLSDRQGLRLRGRGGRRRRPPPRRHPRASTAATGSRSRAGCGAGDEVVAARLRGARRRHEGPRRARPDRRRAGRATPPRRAEDRRRMWLTRLALRNPVFILMMSLMTVVLGFVSLRRLSVDLFPDINIPVIRVATFYTGAGPADIEKTITEPIERAVGASPGVDRVESISQQGVLVGERLVQLRRQPGQRPVRGLAAGGADPEHAAARHPAALHHQVRHHQHPGRPDRDERRGARRAAALRPRLQHHRAAARAHQRRRQRQRRRRQDPRDRGRGQARRAAGPRPRAARRGRRGARSRTCCCRAATCSAGDRDYNVFSNTQVARGAAARRRDRAARDAGAGAARGRRRSAIGDIAGSRTAPADQTEIVRINGQRGVYLRVLKQPGANTIAVVDAVRAALPNLRGVPPNVQLAISFDQSHYIRVGGQRARARGGAGAACSRCWSS